jgi:hypothetical protein
MTWRRFRVLLNNMSGDSVTYVLHYDGKGSSGSTVITDAAAGEAAFRAAMNPKKKV